MQCPICNNEYKGKIGVGVHLKRSHTSEERSKLSLSYLTNLLPLTLAVILAIGACQHLGKKEESNVNTKALSSRKV